MRPGVSPKAAEAAGPSPGVRPGGETALLFESHSAGVYRFLYRLLRDAELASDLTQESFLRLVRAAATGKIADPQAWLFRVAHNLALTLRKRHGRIHLIRFDDLREADQPRTLPGESDPPRPDSLDEMGDALASLSRQERACLELRAEGLRYRQIAAVLGVEIPTVATFLARAVRKISDSRARKGRPIR